MTGRKQGELLKDEAVSAALVQGGRRMTYEQLLGRLSDAVEAGDISSGLGALTEHVGGAGYLLMRQDANSENTLENVIASDWPFDLVRKSVQMLADLTRVTELDKCLSVLQPQFSMLADSAVLPRGASNQYCSIAFNVGRNRYCLILLCPVDMILSQQGLRATGVHASYLASLLFSEQTKAAGWN